MFEPDRLIDSCNEYYIKRINDNKDKLLEAFVMHYGEKHREVITNRFEKIIFCWYVSDFISYIYDEYICKKILEDRIEYTKEILIKIGYNIDKIKCKGVPGKIFKNKGKFMIDSGSISSVIDQDNNSLDEVLKALFGETQLFDFDYETNKLYNFFSLNETQQKEFVKKIFGLNEMNEEVILKIKKAIEYMNSIKPETQKENMYANYYLFDEYIKKKKKKKSKLSTFVNKFFNRKDDSHYKEKIIGASDNILFSESCKDLLNYLNDKLGHEPIEKAIDTKYKLVAFPILYTKDEIFIHEINHAITSSVLAIIDNDNEGKTLLTKTGLDVTGDTVALEELLNDKSSEEITENFHQLGGKLFDYENIEIPTISFYEKTMVIIEPFYQKYKKILSDARITENANLIYKYVDRTILYQFKTFVSGVLSQIKDRVDSGKEPIYSDTTFLTREQIERSKELIEKMDRPKPAEEDITSFIKQLEAEGRKITYISNDQLEEELESSHRKR